MSSTNFVLTSTTTGKQIAHLTTNETFVAYDEFLTEIYESLCDAYGCRVDVLFDDTCTQITATNWDLEACFSGDSSVGEYWNVSWCFLAIDKTFANDKKTLRVALENFYEYAPTINTNQEAQSQIYFDAEMDTLPQPFDSEFAKQMNLEIRNDIENHDFFNVFFNKK
jgi:hypothetical protein